VCSRVGDDGDSGGDVGACGDAGASGGDCRAGAVWSCGGDAVASSICSGAAPSCCGADDEGCSIKTCAIALRSRDAECCGASNTISHLCHRLSPRQL
jgi:hypothetical protein